MMRRRLALISVVLLGVALVVVAALRLRGTNGTPTGDQAVDQSKAVVAKLDELVPQLLEENDVPGAAVALVWDGEVAWSAGYGLADRERGVPVTADTVFQVASISKSVTAWGVMRLVESGKLELDAPVEQYLTRWHLPPSRYDTGGVTIRRLLSHTAGLSLHGYPGILPDRELPTLEESLSGNNGGAGDVRLTMEPGAQFSYSGGGYTLLQLVIEEVTGESFSEFMQEQVLQPLGMLHSSFEWRTDLRPATAVAYSKTGAPLPNYLFTEKAAAGLYTTAPDLARFVAAAMPGPRGEPAGRGVLTADTLALMFTPVLQGQGEAEYGLGHSISTQPDGSKEVSHGGANMGWRALFVALPEQGQGIVILTNSDKGDAGIDAVMSAVAEIVDGHAS